MTIVQAGMRIDYAVDDKEVTSNRATILHSGAEWKTI